MSMSDVLGAGGAAAGGRAGAVLGGAIGEVFGPPGAVVGAIGGGKLGSMGGRAAGTWLGSKIDRYNSDADRLSDDKDKTKACATCKPPKSKCEELRDEIHRKMYGQKGDGADQKGLFQRRDEQINGEFGPDRSMITRKLDKQSGTWRLQEKIPWDTHDRAITNIRRSLKDLLKEYQSEGCYGDPNAKINREDFDRAVRDGFNPKPDEWKGPGV